MSQEAKIRVVAFEKEDYDRQLLSVFTLASKKYQRVFYYCLSRQRSEVLASWKNQDIHPEKFKIIDIGSIKVEKPRLLPELEKLIKNDVEFNFADLVIFDSLSYFNDLMNWEKMITVLNTLLMRTMKKKITCVLPIWKDDINSKIVDSISKFVDDFIDWKKPDVNTLVKELRVLTDNILGRQSSSIMIGASEGETPETLLDQYEQVMATILGPTNARTQLEDFRVKYAGEFI